MITRPLDLVARLSPPPRDLDFVAWINGGVIVLFFSLLGSRFILAPGPMIGVNGGDQPFVLPNLQSEAELVGSSSVVVSFRRSNVILFEGGMYTLPELRRHLAGYAKDHPGAVMLVRADAQVSVQDFLALCDMARAVGFAGVQAAAEPPGQSGSLK
jgi:biopolymer transport protein ExbD